jgi:hypothetical protein
VWKVGDEGVGRVGGGVSGLAECKADILMRGKIATSFPNKIQTEKDETIIAFAQ